MAAPLPPPPYALALRAAVLGSDPPHRLAAGAPGALAAVAGVVHRLTEVGARGYRLVPASRDRARWVAALDVAPFSDASWGAYCGARVPPVTLAELVDVQQRLATTPRQPWRAAFCLFRRWRGASARYEYLLQVGARARARGARLMLTRSIVHSPSTKAVGVSGFRGDSRRRPTPPLARRPSARPPKNSGGAPAIR